MPFPRQLAFLDGIGAMEMMLVAIVGLLLFGGKGLPDMARTAGRMIREFKKATQGVEEEVRRVIHEQPTPPARPRPLPRLAERPAPPPPSAGLGDPPDFGTTPPASRPKPASDDLPESASGNNTPERPAR